MAKKGSKSGMELETQRVSVRDPQGVFWLRISLLFLVSFSLPIPPESLDSETSSVSKKWGNEFVLTHDLLHPVGKSNQLVLANSPIELEKKKLERIEIKNEKLASNVTVEQKVVKAESAIETDEIVYLPEQLEEEPIVLSQSSNQLLVNKSEEKGSLFLSACAPMNSLVNDLNYEINNKWFLMLTVGPQTSEGVLTTPTNLMYQDASEMTNMIAKSGGSTVVENKMGMSLDLALGYNIHPKLELISGVRLTRFKGTIESYFDSEVTQNQEILTAVASNNNDGTKSFSNRTQSVSYKNYFSDTVKADYSRALIEVPLTVRYKKDFGKLNGFLGTGISGVFGSNYEARYVSNEIGNGVIERRSTGLLGMKWNIGFGLEYEINQSVQVILTPEYSLGSSFNNQVFDPNFKSIGIWGGVKYQLR